MRAFQVVGMLRRAGVSADVDIMRRGVGKSLRYASSINAKYAVIVGEKELESDSVTLRDMASGEQSLVRAEELPKRLKE